MELLRQLVTTVCKCMTQRPPEMMAQTSPGPVGDDQKALSGWVSIMPSRAWYRIDKAHHLQTANLLLLANISSILIHKWGFWSEPHENRTLPGREFCFELDLGEDLPEAPTPTGEFPSSFTMWLRLRTNLNSFLGFFFFQIFLENTAFS